MPAVVIGLAVSAVVVALAVNAWIRIRPPVSQGSAVAVLGKAQSCDPAEYGDASVACYEVPFAEGAGVGIGFSVRNTAPVPMTIVSVESLEPPALTPAYLHPELVTDGFMFGLGAGRPFEPIEVASGEEVALQLVGTYLECEAVAESHSAGGALIIDRARMTVRWAFLETDVEVPLTGALSLPGPTSCPG